MELFRSEQKTLVDASGVESYGETGFFGRRGWSRLGSLDISCGYCRSRFIEFRRPRLKAGRLRSNRAIICNSCATAWAPSEFDTPTRRRLRAAGTALRGRKIALRPNHLYVIALDLGDGGGAAFYVGQSARTPEVRFQQHLEGTNAARVIRQRGRHLLPPLYAEWNPLLGSEARLLEAAMFDALHALYGNRVRGGT